MLTRWNWHFNSDRIVILSWSCFATLNQSREKQTKFITLFLTIKAIFRLLLTLWRLFLLLLAKFLQTKHQNENETSFPNKLRITSFYFILLIHFPEIIAVFLVNFIPWTKHYLDNVDVGIFLVVNSSELFLIIWAVLRFALQLWQEPRSWLLTN